MLCSLFWFGALGIRGWDGFSKIIFDLTAMSIIGLFISGVGLLSLSRWAWYPAVIFITSSIVLFTYFILNAGWDWSGNLAKGFITFPLIIWLFYLLSPKGKKQFSDNMRERKIFLVLTAILLIAFLALCVCALLSDIINL